MADLIDRQAAIDAVDRERKKKHLFNTAEDGLLEARRVINTLPSAPPERKTGRWIPVTERLPKVDEYVLVSYHFDGDSEFFPPFDGVTISYWTGVKNHNIPHFADMGDACTVLAWMPLPEAYKGGNDGKTD